MPQHKFQIGQLVTMTPSLISTASGEYTIVRLMPLDGDAPMYMVKGRHESHERMAREHELTPLPQPIKPPEAPRAWRSKRQAESKAAVKVKTTSHPGRSAMAKTPARSRKSGTAKAAAKGKRAHATSKRSAAKKSAPAKRSQATTKVMGVAIPKTLTNALDTLINSPRGREILASAIVAAASAAAASLVRSDSPQAAKAREAITDTGDQVASATKDLSAAAAGALAGLVTGVASSLLPSSRSKPGEKVGEGE